MGQSLRALSHMRALEACAAGRSFIHRRHPVAVVLVTLCCLITVASFGRYVVGAMLPMLFYPLFVLSVGEVPPGLLVRRLLPALPLILGIGLFNPLFDRVPVEFLPGISVWSGVVSFASIALRGVLCVSVALLLVAVSGVDGVSAALRTLRVPRVFVTLFVLTYRYIQTLVEEAERISVAYSLRAPRKKAPSPREWGVLAGQWLLRTLRRADRLYNAMKCRGYRGELPSSRVRRWEFADTLYLTFWCAFFVLTRLVDIPQVLGGLFVRG